MDFGEALRAVKDGRRVTRAVWKDGQPAWRGAYLELVPARTLDDGRQMMPVLMIGYENQGHVLRPFSGANWDLLSDDWEIA